MLDAGLGYLGLDRMTRSLSGGETERVNLTGCLGSRLVNTLFVLDEPSVGLHPRDTARLVRIVRQLRDAGNTVVVVEHEASVMRAADQIIDLGPGHGASGGEVVFQGTYQEILRAPQSLTGQYLSGKKRIEIPARRPVFVGGRRRPALVLRRANLHNLRDLTVEIPLGRLVCVTGVSGSGKSTLVREVLLPALQERLAGEPPVAGRRGGQRPARLQDADGRQHPPVLCWKAGKSWGGSSRWTNLCWAGRRAPIRRFISARLTKFASCSPEPRRAGQRGLNASAFSFNSAQGQCERCRGAGFEKIEMQFLSDVFIRCPDCNGRRYRPHILEVMAGPPAAAAGTSPICWKRRWMKPSNF